MNDDQIVALFQGLVVAMIRMGERLNQAEETIKANGLNVEVQAPSVSVEPQIRVDAPEMDLSGLVAAITGLTTDNVADGLSAVSEAVSGLSESLGFDVSPLVESQNGIAQALTGSAGQLAELTERSIEAQAKTGDEVSRLADGVEKSTSLNQQQFNALFDRVGELIQTMNAPKELTFDDEGNPVGVQTMLRQ